MIQKTEHIWLDGRFVPWGDANFHFLTHSLHYGCSVFEGIRCRETKDGPAIFRLRDHIERLFNSAKLVRMNIPHDVDKIIEAVKLTVKKNNLKACYIRPLVFYGYGVMGLNPKGNPVHVGIACWPWGTYLGEEALEKGVHAKKSSIARVPGELNHAKIGGNYFHSVLAKLESLEKQADEAIMLDTEGYVAEGSGENIFMVKKNMLITPTDRSILPGITRKSIMKIAQDKGYFVKEDKFTIEELYDADEAFFTGTAAELTPITKVDDHVLGEGMRGPVTTELQQAFFDIVNGRNEKYKDWLYYV